MSANKVLSSNQLKIFNICEALYKNELFYKAFLKDQDYYGYLIENKIIDKIKKNINYEKIKTFVDRSEYEQCRKVIKDMEIKLEELTPKQYKKSKELIRELLTDNNSFYLIKQDFLRRILDNSKLTGKEIEFKITKQNSIIFEFSKEDILEFSYNKNFIIEKSSIKGNISDKSNTNNGEDFKIPTGISDSIKFKQKKF